MIVGLSLPSEAAAPSGRVDLSPERFPPPVGGLDFWSMLLIAISSRSVEMTEEELTRGGGVGEQELGGVARATAIGSSGSPSRLVSDDVGTRSVTPEAALPVIDGVPGSSASDRLAPGDSGGLYLGPPDGSSSGVAATVAERPVRVAEEFISVPERAGDLGKPDLTLSASDRDAGRSDRITQVTDLDVGMAGLNGSVTRVGVRDDRKPPVNSDVTIEPTVDTSSVATTHRHSGPVEVADSAVAGLVPDFRGKIETVINRMRSEFGHEVTLVEGYRSPERQAHLYTQGRTRPGSVVTWTRSSLHGEGRAADVMVDGSYTNEKGYARLHEVAAQEGLRTLGARDPGHLEFGPKVPSAIETVTGDVRSEARPIARRAGVMRIASVARVASVATVVRPGDVHAIVEASRPGAVAAVGVNVNDARSASASEGDTSRTSGPIVADGRSVPAEPGTRSEGVPVIASDSEVVVDHRSSKRVTEMGAPSRRRKSKSSPVGPSDPSTATQGDEVMSPSTRVDSPKGIPVAMSAVSSADALSALERVERILETRDMLRNAQPSRISLNLGGDGPITRLRVGLLRGTVDADLDLADGVNRNLMNSRVSELHRALVERGLELGTLGLGAKSQSGTLGADSILPGGLDSALDVMRSLFAGATDSDREGLPRDRTPAQRQTKQDGADSERPRRETKKENDQ